MFVIRTLTGHFSQITCSDRYSNKFPLAGVQIKSDLFSFHLSTPPIKSSHATHLCPPLLLWG